MVKTATMVATRAQKIKAAELFSPDDVTLSWSRVYKAVCTYLYPPPRRSGTSGCPSRPSHSRVTTCGGQCAEKHARVLPNVLSLARTTYRALGYRIWATHAS